MKVVCDRPALLDAVNLVNSVVASRTPRPQLTCVKLSATKGKEGSLTLSATDAEVSLRMTTTHVDVQEAGEALVPAAKLTQIVSAQESDSTITLDADAEVCHVRGADAKFKVFGYPPSEFPPVPGFKEAAASARDTFAIHAADLSAIIARTAFATARETSRYAINGVLLKRDGKRIEMVATDGRRLALAKAGLTNPAPAGDHPTNCIVPTKALNLVQKLIDDGEEVVRVAVTDSQIFFAFGETPGGGGEARAVLSSNLVEGAFPPYQDVIPKDQDKKASFDRDTLMSGVRRAALLTNEESRGVRLSIDSTRLRLSSRAPEMGESEIDVPTASYDGEPIEIGFNPAFITDALKVITDDSVIVELKAPNKPGLIKSGGDFLYVVMPVNLQ
jgi:DNA polymerase-3 subunit beta